MNKNILTDSQLKMKLINYKFDFSSEDFEELKRHGFYHVFNSFVEKSIRKNNKPKKLSDYLKLYKLDFKLRAVLFPMILSLESTFKQRFNDTLVEEIILNQSTSPHYNEVVRYCIKPKCNVEAKKTLFRSCTHKNHIVSHFFDNHNDIPIWAYIELIDLKQFLNIFEFSKDKDDVPKGSLKIKEKFSNNCNFLQENGNQFSENQKADYIFQTLRLIFSVRNNVAHNQPIIDCRFKNNGYKINIQKLESMIKDLSKRIEPNITFSTSLVYDFDTITDTISVIYLMYVYMLGKDEFSNECKLFMENEIKLNNANLNNRIHSKIFGVDNISKVDTILSI